MDKWIKDHYRALNVKPIKATVSALENAGFSFDHTGGNIYVWQRELPGNITLALGDAEDGAWPPEKLADEVIILIYETGTATDIVSFYHPNLGEFLKGMAVWD